jgi:hypothetical protein
VEEGCQRDQPHGNEGAPRIGVCKHSLRHVALRTSASDPHFVQGKFVIFIGAQLTSLARNQFAHMHLNSRDLTSMTRKNSSPSYLMVSTRTLTVSFINHQMERPRNARPNWSGFLRRLPVHRNGRFTGCEMIHLL